MPKGFVLILIPLTKFLNMAMVGNFEVILGQMLKYSVEYCNYVQYHSFVNYFTCFNNIRREDGLFLSRTSCKLFCHLCSPIKF
jgi:hypothetical protein